MKIAFLLASGVFLLIRIVARAMGIALSDTADLWLHFISWLLLGVAIFSKDKKEK